MPRAIAPEVTITTRSPPCSSCGDLLADGVEHVGAQLAVVGGDDRGAELDDQGHGGESSRDGICNRLGSARRKLPRHRRRAQLRPRVAAAAGRLRPRLRRRGADQRRQLRARRRGDRGRRRRRHRRRPRGRRAHLLLPRRPDRAADGDRPRPPGPRRRRGSGTALALGAFLDGIPEQLVLGIDIAAGAGVGVSLLVAIFVSNLPESLGSASDMREAGRSREAILRLWLAGRGDLRPRHRRRLPARRRRQRRRAGRRSTASPPAPCW